MKKCSETLKTAESLITIDSWGGGGLRLAPGAAFQSPWFSKRLFLRRLAFTLSEVLITLGIIGVVAAITMPILLQNHQKRETVTRLQKAYSELNQAYEMGQIENGALQFPNNIKNQKVFEMYFKPFLSGVKECNSGTTCGYANDTPWIQMNGKPFSYLKISQSGQKPFYLKDGTFAMFDYGNDGANTTAFYFIVDVNGPKKPNKLGYDVFSFAIYSYKNNVIWPRGWGSTKSTINSYCNKNSTKTDGAGCFCAIKILRDGWKITYDW